MNEQEASKKAQEMVSNRTNIFCPLSKGYCQITCECYQMPEVYNWDEESRVYNGVTDIADINAYEVRHGFCTCYALKGASD